MNPSPTTTSVTTCNNATIFPRRRPKIHTNLRPDGAIFPSNIEATPYCTKTRVDVRSNNRKKTPANNTNGRPNAHANTSTSSLLSTRWVVNDIHHRTVCVCVCVCVYSMRFQKTTFHSLLILLHVRPEKCNGCGDMCTCLMWEANSRFCIIRVFCVLCAENLLLVMVG